jgi:hypothetical protein
MATEIRYAVRRDDPRSVLTAVRSWWWHTDPREEFAPDWEHRKLFHQKAGALAVIWTHRDKYEAHGEYKFVLVRVRRKFSALVTTKAEQNPAQEARVP